MRIEPIRVDEGSLETYVQLFATCFPTARHLDLDYLRWLYRLAPAGEAIGFDAWSDERLAAHYVCVPASLRIRGAVRRSLLSLNTATHPDFQGKGLFTRLAESTYSAAAERGFEAVYGIANANSTPGFIRKLGFTLVSPLDSTVGLGRFSAVDWSAIERADFARVWSTQELAWRIANPKRPIRTARLADQSTGFVTRTQIAGIRAWAQLPDATAPNSMRIADHGPRVFVGKFPRAANAKGAYFAIPKRLRPSPLNMIIRSLAEPVHLDADNLFISFLDFDAF